MIKLFFDLDGTLARFNVRNALERFDKEEGFFAKLKAYKGIEVINELAKNNEIYIVSASPNEQADKDKMIWIDKYLNNIKKENIIICRIGENKANIIQNKIGINIDMSCYLIDDYSKNLFEWEQAGGIGVKRLTSIADNSRKLWKGKQIKELTQILNLV